MSRRFTLHIPKRKRRRCDVNTSVFGIVSGEFVTVTRTTRPKSLANVNERVCSRWIRVIRTTLHDDYERSGIKKKSFWKIFRIFINIHLHRSTASSSSTGHAPYSVWVCVCVCVHYLIYHEYVARRKDGEGGGGRFKNTALRNADVLRCV